MSGFKYRRITNAKHKALCPIKFGETRYPVLQFVQRCQYFFGGLMRVAITLKSATQRKMIAAKQPVSKKISLKLNGLLRLNGKHHAKRLKLGA